VTHVVSRPGQRRFFLGGEVTVMVKVAVVPATAPVPGETAVTTHWPDPSTVKVDPAITHGPVSLSKTVAPEAAVAFSGALSKTVAPEAAVAFSGVLEPA